MDAVDSPNAVAEVSAWIGPRDAGPVHRGGARRERRAVLPAEVARAERPRCREAPPQRPALSPVDSSSAAVVGLTHAPLAPGHRPGRAGDHRRPGRDARTRGGGRGARRVRATGEARPAARAARVHARAAGAPPHRADPRALAVAPAERVRTAPRERPAARGHRAERRRLRLDARGAPGLPPAPELQGSPDPHPRPRRAHADPARRGVRPAVARGRRHLLDRAPGHRGRSRSRSCGTRRPRSTPSSTSGWARATTPTAGTVRCSSPHGARCRRNFDWGANCTNPDGSPASTYAGSLQVSLEPRSGDRLRVRPRGPGHRIAALERADQRHRRGRRGHGDRARHRDVRRRGVRHRRAPAAADPVATSRRRRRSTRAGPSPSRPRRSPRSSGSAWPPRRRARRRR